MTHISVVCADITTLKVDAIVNAANSSLLGGGGVDGAIHKAAGPELLIACRSLGGCRAGSAKLTSGYNLPARFIIHAVGPIWQGGDHGESELLASCYRCSLKIAAQNQLQSIAFPSISTGVFGFPFRRAALIAVAEVYSFVTNSPNLVTVLFCTYSNKDMDEYLRILKNIT
jgi:O-acetyl-ADP-ribose deacetylase (regulator of RNase III)